LRIHLLGTTKIEGQETWIADLGTNADGNIVGGTAHTDTHHVFKTVNVSCLQEILVPRREPILFEVVFHAQTSCENGDVKIEFDKDDPFVHCPVLLVAFQQPLISFSETLIEDSAGWEGFCLVQRIEPVRLSRSGTQVKLTLRASSVSSASIDRIYISQADPAGEPFDSGDDLTAVTSVPFVIPAGAKVTLPAVNYNFNRTKPLLIAVDFSDAPASAIRVNLAVPPEQASSYFQQGAAAATANRTDFTPEIGLGLIERIEVF